MLPLSLAELNGRWFTPKKDYATNRLRAGLLQLSAQTELVVDETAMQPGQLDANGICVTFVSAVILEQIGTRF